MKGDTAVAFAPAPTGSGLQLCQFPRGPARNQCASDFAWWTPPDRSPTPHQRRVALLAINPGGYVHLKPLPHRVSAPRSNTRSAAVGLIASSSARYGFDGTTTPVRAPSLG
ncbi:MAG: hypothetical protein H6636_01155 [Anaerolineales bacterium]|nr:hypothetical protein [Anaerolineales bacterium]